MAHYPAIFLSLLALMAAVSGFVCPVGRGSATSLSMTVGDAPPPSMVAQSTSVAPFTFNRQPPISTASATFNSGARNFISHESTSTIMTSSHIVSLKERPPPPTAEEIAAKQRTFNLWFWGGGFVAPFLATFYYFGFKFWER